MSAGLTEAIRNAIEWAAPFSGICFRNVTQAYVEKDGLLSTKGSLISGGRFNFKGAFGVLYLSCDQHTCDKEVEKYLQANPVLAARQRICAEIEVVLRHVMDLTDKAVLKKLNIVEQSLLADWERRQNFDQQEAFTQQIGRLARDAGFEAILVPSVVARGKNLDVFPDRLLKGSYLKMINRNLLPLER